MGIDIVAGRAFTERDTISTPGAVVVSESLARYLWPTEEPLGQRLVAIGAEIESDGDPVWQTVVGVVRDARYREIEHARFNLYVPFTQVPMNVANLVVRTARDPSALVGPVRDEVRRRDPSLVVGEAATLESIVSTVMRPWRFNMMISSLFAVLALLLSAIGLFGTVAYSVADRTREIGLRRALGARTGVVLWVVSRQTMTLMFLGARVGLVLSLATSRLIAPLLFGVSPTDAEALLSFTVLLLLTSALASFLAAYRATRIDPMVALQTE